MGGSSSSRRRNKAVTKLSKAGDDASFRIKEEDYLDSGDSNSSDGEWDNLPPLPKVQHGITSRHYILKILFVGDCQSGKTSLFFRYVEETFNCRYISTIGIDFKIKSITMDERRFKLQIWDTSGQERFRTITTAYYRGSQGVFLVYDTLNEDSFDKLHKWVRDIKENTSPNVPLTLLGNKCDLKKENDDHFLKAKNFADEHGMAFFEVSAKDGTNIELAITNMTARIWRTIIKSSADD